ncbi:MAG: pyruvate kinase [Acidobacteriota bacterium]
MERRARIVATVGPASSSETVLGRLLEAGVDVVRLNLSHGSHAEHRRRIRLLRRLAEARGLPVPVIADLMGPRYRLGELPAERVLRTGERVSLGEPGRGVDLPVDGVEILRHLRKGERVLIDNGLVELRVETKSARTVRARVIFGGPVSTRKGINLPDSELPFTISAKDRADISFAVREGVDFLALSYVGRAVEIEAIRAVARAAGRDLPVIAKLERALAIEYLDEIVESADSVMVARGDLGVEVALDRVPVLQKQIVAAGRRLGKPVIVATQMLESMMIQPRPTRAEASDVANAVFDGADALMLSGETAAGRFPVEAVATMDRVIREAERYRWSPEGRAGWSPHVHVHGPLRPGGTESVNQTRDVHFDIPDVVCESAVEAARRLGDGPIVAFSQGGFTARMIARYRPAVPIVVFTADRRTARRMQLIWGVRPLLIPTRLRRLDEVVAVVDRELLARRLVQAGETIVILMGDPIAERPLTNLMRVHRVRRKG